MKKEFGIGLLLVALCAAVTIMNPRFLSGENLRNLSQLIGMFGIFSMGMGIVIITGGIDLSVGSAFALQGVLLALMLREWHFPWLLAALAAIASMVLLGVFHGLLICKLRLQPFIVTLCGLLIYRGVARVISRDETRGFGESNWGFLRPLATGYLGPFPMSLVLMVVVGVIMYIVLHHSAYGRYLFAVGRNEEAARYSGINTQLVIGSAYAVSMLLASFTGIILAFYSNSISPSTHGTYYELYGIAAAVLGGCSLRGGEGSIIGILLGTALLQVLQNLVNLLGIPSSLNFAVMGTVILLGTIVDQLVSSRFSRRRTAGFEVAPASPVQSPPETRSQSQ